MPPSSGLKWRCSKFLCNREQSSSLSWCRAPFGTRDRVWRSSCGVLSDKMARRLSVVISDVPCQICTYLHVTVRVCPGRVQRADYASCQIVLRYAGSIVAKFKPSVHVSCIGFALSDTANFGFVIILCHFRLLPA